MVQLTARRTDGKISNQQKPKILFNTQLKEILSNRGRFFKSKFKAYKYKYYDYDMMVYRNIPVTFPFIDKITMKGNAGIKDRAELEEFITWLNLSARDCQESPSDYYEIRYVSMSFGERRACGYSNQYIIRFRGRQAEVRMFVDPIRGGKLIKFEFNLQKLKKKDSAFWKTSLMRSAYIKLLESLLLKRAA